MMATGNDWYTNDAETEQPRFASDRARIGSDRGAVGTEMAIVVAVVVGIALLIGGIMRGAAEDYGECIPTPGEADSCAVGGGGGN